MKLKHLLLSLLYLFVMFTAPLHAYYEGEDLGYVDEVSISGREFESFNKYEIEFYKEDLVDGKITIEGILESETEKISIEKLNVEISVDGGDSWNKASGHENWSFTFAPESGKKYELSLRVVNAAIISPPDQSIQLISPQDALVLSSITQNIPFSWDHTGKARYKVIITDQNGHNKHSYSSNNTQLKQNILDMIKVDGNSLKWYVEAYPQAKFNLKHDALKLKTSKLNVKGRNYQKDNLTTNKTTDKDKNSVLKSSTRVLYFPDLSMSASVEYKKKEVVESINISQGTINISSSKLAKLKGIIKNAKDNPVAVDVSIKNDVEVLLTKQIILSSNSNTEFNFDLVSTLNEGDNPLILTLERSVESSASNRTLSESFTVARTDKNVYEIGTFELLTDVLPNENGMLSGIGKITVSVLDKFSDCDGTLDVAFSNLIVTDGKITAGKITYIPDAATPMEMTPPKSKIIVNQVVFKPSDAYIIGSIDITKIGSYVASTHIDAPHISLQADKFSLETTLNWTTQEGGGQNVKLFDGVFAFSLILKTAHISIDTSREWYSTVLFSDITGGVSFGSIFDGTNTSFTITDDLITWKLNDDVKAKINAEDTYSFINAGGTIREAVDGNSAYVSLNGNIRVYLNNSHSEYFDVGTGTNGLKIDSTGLNGSASFQTSAIGEGTQAPKLAGIPISISEFILNFEGDGVSGGSLKVNVNYNDFLHSGKKFNFDVSAMVSATGISNYQIVTTGDGILFDIDGFASFKFSNLALDTTLETRHFTTDMTVTPKQENLASGDVDLVFEALQLDADGVSIKGGSIWKELVQDGAAGISIFGIEVYVSKVGFGISNEKMFIGVEGSGGIGGEIVSIDSVKVAMFEDGSMSLLNSPVVEADSSVVNFKGSLVTTEENGIKGITANGDLQIKNIGDGIHINGNFTCGTFLDDAGESTDSYWRVSAYASTGTPISLAPVPMNLYGFGGGVGYNVSYNAVNHKWEPLNNSETTISITTVFGTTDGGYTLHGPATLSISTGGQITFDTTMYITSGLMQSPEDRKVEIAAQLTASPFRFFADGNAHVTKEAASNYKILEVNGNVQMQFSSSNSYIYIGQKSSPISANFLEILSNDGYLMLDDSGMAFGYSMQLKKRGSCCLMYGSIDVGASIDMIIGVRPFYIDAEGKLWAIVSAGVEYKSFSYEIFNAGAKISARFRAPNPTFGKLDVELTYSILGGAVSGNYDMTYWINKPSDGELTASVKTAENIDLFKYMLPAADDIMVSRFPEIEISTVLPINKRINIDSLIDEPTGVEYKFIVHNMTSWTDNNNNGIIESEDIQQAENPNEYISLVDLNASSRKVTLLGGRTGAHSKNIVLRPLYPLIPGHTYRADILGVLIESESGELIGGDRRMQSFTVTKEEDISFRSVVEEVHPRMGAKGVYKQTDLYMRVRGVSPSYTDAFSINLYDPLDRKIGRKWRVTYNDLDNSDASRMFAFISDNHPDLTPIVTYTCNETGERKEAFYTSEGLEKNPFTYVPPVMADPITYVPAIETVSFLTTESIVNKKTVAKKVIDENIASVAVGATVQTDSPEAEPTQVYTYKRKVLTKYTIKATQDVINDVTGEKIPVNLFSSTFDVYVPHPEEFTNPKTGEKSTGMADYNTDISMLKATISDYKFKIVRAPIDFNAERMEWREKVIDPYNSRAYQCEEDIPHWGGNYVHEHPEQYASYMGVEDEYHDCINHAHDYYVDTVGGKIHDKYSKGELSHMLFSFRYKGHLDPENISLHLRPGCKIRNAIGKSARSFNPNQEDFSNLDAAGNYLGSLGYQVIESRYGYMEVKMNLSIHPEVRDSLYERVSKVKKGNRITESSCGSIIISPRKLTTTGSIESDVKEEQSYSDLYKTNVRLFE